MAETPDSPPPAQAEVETRLEDVAQRLRQPGPLNPESRRALAELVEELRKILEETAVPPAEVTQLAESTAHLAESLHQPPDHGLLAAARDRLEQAVGNAEAHAPLTVGLARRLLDALAQVGI
jgi:hypothetical protein